MLTNRWIPALLYPITVLALSTFVAGRVPPSYFSDSHNLFNVYFVKLGWLWTTVAYVSLLNGDKKSWLRYILSTAYWFCITQWLLGPSFIDRVFVATGGSCSSDILMQSQATCRQTGGQWIGGHDVSGHCVLLVHASLFLWEEQRAILLKNNTKKYGLYIVYGFLALWWWMLCMTSTYFFHGQRELVSGTFFGMFGWVIMVGIHTYLCCGFRMTKRLLLHVAVFGHVPFDWSCGHPSAISKAAAA